MRELPVEPPVVPLVPDDVATAPVLPVVAAVVPAPVPLVLPEPPVEPEDPAPPLDPEDPPLQAATAMANRNGMPRSIWIRLRGLSCHRKQLGCYPGLLAAYGGVCTHLGSGTRAAMHEF
jgi:hypothetical protein